MNYSHRLIVNLEIMYGLFHVKMKRSEKFLSADRILFKTCWNFNVRVLPNVNRVIKIYHRKIKKLTCFMNSDNNIIDIKSLVNDYNT